MDLMKKTEFYQKMNTYYLDKSGKKPYTAEQSWVDNCGN